LLTSSEVTQLNLNADWVSPTISLAPKPGPACCDRSSLRGARALVLSNWKPIPINISIVHSSKIPDVIGCHSARQINMRRNAAGISKTYLACRQNKPKLAGSAWQARRSSLLGRRTEAGRLYSG
jgi:hypothetical protein